MKFFSKGGNGADHRRNSGLGLEFPRLLAGHGADVIKAGQNRKMGQQGWDQIKAGYPHANLALMPLGLADLTSITDFSEALKKQYG
ncbi:MAG: hypothetical protein R3292_14930 [Alcanivorax sp.]|nr:hypothetical protein [Alcanivorax sp.]